MTRRQDDIVIRFSERLRQLRKKYGMTQEGLADKADLSYKNIQYLESKNPTCPSLKTLAKLANAFNLSLSKLLDF